MKLLNVLTGLLLSFTVGSSFADVELSNLIQWEESQNDQSYSATNQSDEGFVANINSMEATAAGNQAEFSNLVQWEEAQYAQPYGLKDQSDEAFVANINSLDPSSAGIKHSGMSNLIQWEESQ